MILERMEIIVFQPVFVGLLTNSNSYRKRFVRKHLRLSDRRITPGAKDVCKKDRLQLV
jgi:hypothetical protein